jgi:hypothetical protein
VVPQYPPLSPAGVPPSGNGRSWFAPALVGIGAGVLVVIVALVGLVVLGQEDEAASPSSRSGVVDSAGQTTPPTSSVITSTTVPASPVAPAPVPQPTVTPVSTTVPPTLGPVRQVVVAIASRTCGRTGDGDCFVSVRTGPATTEREVRRLLEGQSVEIECELYGEPVWTSVLGEETNVWARAVDGTYLFAGLLFAPGLNPDTVTIPCPG